MISHLVAASAISHLLTDSNGAVTRKQNPISKPSGIVDRLWASWSLESSFNCLRRCGNNLVISLHLPRGVVKIVIFFFKER